MSTAATSALVEQPELRVIATRHDNGCGCCRRVVTDVVVVATRFGDVTTLEGNTLRSLAVSSEGSRAFVIVLGPHI